MRGGTTHAAQASHVTLREAREFDLTHCPSSTQTQITWDAVSKHSPPCPSGYRVIRHCLVSSSEADRWPQANSLSTPFHPGRGCNTKIKYM